MGIEAFIGPIGDIFMGWLNQEEKRKQNEKDRKYQEMATQRQRQWDTEDWEKTNKYNSPQEQMNRLRQAGLNPNLVYGKGADNTANMVRGGATQGQSSQEAATFDFKPSNSILAYQQVKNVKAQTDNLGADMQLKQKESMLKDANIAKTMQDTATSEFELEKAKELKDSVIQRAQLENQALQTNTDLNINKDQREQLKNNAEVPNIIRQTINAELQTKLMQLQMSTNLQEQRKREEEIKNLQIMQENAKLDAKLKQLDINLKKMGIQPGDPMYMRAISQFLSKNQFSSTINGTDMPTMPGESPNKKYERQEH